MYPKFDILGCKGMAKTFHFIGDQTNMVHTLGTLCCYFEGQALACPIDKLKESRKTASRVQRPFLGCWKPGG